MSPLRLLGSSGDLDADELEEHRAFAQSVLDRHVDLFDLSDRELFVDRMFGNLIPRPGWPGRGRAIAIRMLQVALLTVGIILAIVGVSLLIVVLWAGGLPR